jgi:hypothetical protein
VGPKIKKKNARGKKTPFANSPHASPIHHPLQASLLSFSPFLSFPFFSLSLSSLSFKLIFILVFLHHSVSFFLSFFLNHNILKKTALIWPFQYSLSIVNIGISHYYFFMKDAEEQQQDQQQEQQQQQLPEEDRVVVLQQPSISSYSSTTSTSSTNSFSLRGLQRSDGTLKRAYNTSQWSEQEDAE